MQSLLIYLIVFILGIILAVVLIKPFQKAYKSFFSKAPIIRRYWSFVVPFTMFIVIIYWLVLKYSAIENTQNYLSIAGQLSALIFAIFIGYFAFLQLVENRIGGLKMEGFNYFKRKSYARAIKTYEEILAIDTKNFYSLSEIMELYLIQKDFRKFDEKNYLLDKNVLDRNDFLIIFYLRISRHLLKQHLEEAKEELKKLVDFRKANRDATMIWDFSDIKNSPAYIGMPGGEAKNIFDNMVRYLYGGFSPEEKEKFENYNYI